MTEILLYMKTIRELWPIFFGCDGINYSRNETFYWELLTNLKFKHEELYHSFLQGHFVVMSKTGYETRTDNSAKCKKVQRHNWPKQKGRPLHRMDLSLP